MVCRESAERKGKKTGEEKALGVRRSPFAFQPGGEHPPPPHRKEKKKLEENTPAPYTTPPLRGFNRGNNTKKDVRLLYCKRGKGRTGGEAKWEKTFTWGKSRLYFGRDIGREGKGGGCTKALKNKKEKINQGKDRENRENK